ncbi:MAG: hypothetical protein LBE31_03145 [Deltaproteobacteria bacterium]|jgi:hypothetical protein|nr:hypothetical protein [Deltaproteobacteria bacterium]
MSFESLPDVLESAMLVSFGCAWPANIINTLRVKCSRGRTPVFLIIVILGYVFGLLAKILSPKELNYVAFFYILNLVLVSTDLCLYFYYLAKDRQKT